MFASLKRILLVGGLLGLGGLAAAQEPGEPLPVPRPLPLVPSPAHPPYHPYVRTSRYEVWQNLAVDRFGYFKPVVVYSPHGAYYRYDGRPFPWAHNHPLDWMPYVVDEVPFRPPPPHLPRVLHE